MRLVLFQTPGRDEPVPGLLTDRGVVDISSIAEKGHTPQSTMQALIDGFDRLRPSLERRATEGEALPLSSVRLRAPLPRPGKILCCIANYWEHAQREARPLNMFLKNPGRVTRSCCRNSPSRGSLCTKPSWRSSSRVRPRG